MLGVSADQLFISKTENMLEYESVFAQALFKDYLVKVKVKAEMVNDERRVKNTVLTCTPLDYNFENAELLSLIGRY